jgi:hypothetical protein
MTIKAQNIIKALNPRFWVGAVTCRFSLRSGDIVFVSVFNGRKVTKKAKVKGFTAYGIHYENHPYINWHHYCTGLFYGFGYHNKEYVIVTTKRWHIPFAWLCEKLRLSISEKWAIRFGLQNGR